MLEARGLHTPVTQSWLRFSPGAIASPVGREKQWTNLCRCEQIFNGGFSAQAGRSMPISAAQSDAQTSSAAKGSRPGAWPRTRLVRPRSIRQLTGDQSTATEDDIPDSPMEAAAIGANGSLGDAESDLPTSEVGLPVPVPTNGDVFALDELLEDFPEPPADVMRQAADPS